MTLQIDPQSQRARTRLTQIFRYVQAFNHLQNPIQGDIEQQPWHLWLLRLPDHPAIRKQIALPIEDVEQEKKNVSSVPV